MLAISATQEWSAAHHGALVGLLELSGVANDDPSERLADHKRETEAALRSRFAGLTRSDFLKLPIMASYAAYYKRFDKTYHVLLQLESIVIKGKHLPDVSPLVDSNFAAELETLVLTAGHDPAKLAGPLFIDVSREGDRMTRMSGEPKSLRSGDMIMRDSGGVSCSIIYGQDNRSPLTSRSQAALYVAYAPPGVPREAVEAQLEAIETNVRRFAPAAVVERQQIITA